jgi:hypothetical protein
MTPSDPGVDLGLDLGLDPAIERHPLVASAHRLAAILLAPAAEAVDGSTVPRSHLDALGAAGLLGIAAPETAGGTQAPPSVARRVTEVLAGADLSTWFVQAQHHGPVRALAAAGTHPELLADLAAGRTVAGTAFSHLRRADGPVRAGRERDGWRLDGTAPWYTGWGLNDVALVGAATPDGQVVTGLVAAQESPGVRAGDPVRVAAVQAARTVPLLLDGHLLADADVVAVRPVGEWARDDARVTVNASPAVFGLTESAILLLACGAPGRPAEPVAVAAARRLAARLVAVRGAVRHLLDDVPPDEEVPRRLELRAQAGRLAVEATTALVVAGAGGAMSLASPAQRKVREAVFLLVQAQTRPARVAALDAVGR